jgi:hypothetical protein
VAQDQASVREGSVWAGQDPARRVEAPVPAVLVEDCREGKEHLEFEKASTSCLFGTAIGPGRTAWIALFVRIAASEIKILPSFSNDNTVTKCRSGGLRDSCAFTCPGGRFSAANAGRLLDLNEKSSSIRYLLDEEKVRDTNALGL